MRRAAACAAVFFALTSAAGPVGAQTTARRIALVYEVGTPPLFAPNGVPADTADFNIEMLLQRLRALESDHDETKMSFTLNGVLCDELNALGTSTAKRAVAALRRISGQHQLLPAPYSDARASVFTSKAYREDVQDGRAAAEACLGASPGGPFVPNGLSVTDADRLADLRAADVQTMLSAFAVPPTTQRPEVVPAVVVDGEGSVDLATARPEAEGLVVVVAPDGLSELRGIVDDEGLDIVDITRLDDTDVIGGVIDPDVDVPRERTRAIRNASDAIDRFDAYTLEDNPLRDIYRTILARSRGAKDGIDRVRRLGDEIARQRRLITVTEGSVTFTSRRGAVPVTISNGARYPVWVRIELRPNAKLDFLELPETQEIAPPGDTITFQSLARSSGSFPIVVVLKSDDGTVTFGDAEITVRSVSANLSAVILTAGGAAFLLYWFIRRIRRRGQTQETQA